MLTSVNLVHFTPDSSFPKSFDRTENEISEFFPIDSVNLSGEHEHQGTLNPVVIEQTGNKTTTTLHAETDSKTNDKINISIDTANDWFGSRASVNLWNLERLYVVNGSLSEGLEGSNSYPNGSVPDHPFGWDAISGSPDPGMELAASYYNQEISVQTRGYGGGGNYFFADGTYVYWIQSINNTPYLENFILNFDYYYDVGPDAHPNVTLRAYINDGLIWNSTTETILTSLWYNTGDIPVNLTGIGSQFEFKIGLFLDGNVSHTKQFIEFTLDSIRFVGATPPEFDDAIITLNIDEMSTPISGTSLGQASISNPSLWQTENVLLELKSGLAYAFDYKATLLSHRYFNSTRSTTQLDDGVRYSVQSNENPLLEFYTFIGVIPDIDDFTMIIRIPVDWENVTVYNAFGNPVTTSCIISVGKIVVPTSILYTLGWWEVHIESPNYVRNLQTLKWIDPSWTPDAIFRSSNIARPTVEIGGSSPVSGTLQNVNFTWIMPDATQWFSEVIPTGGIDGVIDGSPLEFGQTNSTAGLWEVIVSWKNGTELAFGCVSFEVHHGATLSPHEDVIEAESGLSISNFVYYRDSENNDFLMDPGAIITANWSVSTVNFVPDQIQNRWVGTFDTSLVGPGTHLVVVNATRPFFDDTSCSFFVNIIITDNELTIETPPTEIGLGDSVLATFSYSDASGNGIPDANVSYEYTGPADGITWTELTDFGDGNYSVEFTAVHSGNYAITISASRDYYEESQDTLILLVGDIGTSLSLKNGTSASISFGEEYRLVVRYTNISGFGLPGAIVRIIGANPSSGITFTNATDEGDGYYSFILTPTNTGPFTIFIDASLLDHGTQYESFTLNALEISTQLRIAGGASSASVGVTQPFEILVFYEELGSSHTNISLASLHVNFTSYDILEPEISPLTEGYLIQFPTDQMGRYEFSITATKIGYQLDSVQFTLYVRERAIRIEMEPPVWYRLSDMNITLELFEVDTDQPVTDAVVTYRLKRLGDVVMEGYLNETSPGVHSVFIRPQWGSGSGYTLHLFVEKANFVLDSDYEYTVLQITPPGVTLRIFFRTVLPPAVIFVVVSLVSLAGRTVYLRKKEAEFALDLVNKRRFEDADNIIGVIVMHKVSGIPIYSRIVKGGFEEGIVAAFIAAVTHFREEFEMLEEEAMHVIPISDIIRAVQTQNLICAFITVRSASIEHNRKMEAFGMQVGTYLDDFFAESTPMSAQDSRIDEILTYIYDETMDGNLLKFHKISAPEKLPKKYQSIERVMLDADTSHCSRPIYLAKAVSKYGVSEARGCTLVSEVLEKRLIIPCDEHEIPEIEIDLVSYLEKETSDAGD
jgi:hypothetical protein